MTQYNFAAFTFSIVLWSSQVLNAAQYGQSQDRKRHTDLENGFMVARGEGSRKGIVRGFRIDMYTLLYLKWITNKALLYSTGNSAQCYGAPWM